MELPAGSKSREPIAIVGIGCRYPGGIEDAQSFWRTVCAGIDAISDVPKSRWDLRSHYDSDPARTGKMIARQGGFLRQPHEEFDAAFFGIAPREAMRLDPIQRWLMESAWEAMEDAGIVPASLAGSATGVFVGGFFLDMSALALGSPNRDLIDGSTASSTTATILSERLSYLWDLRGPSISIDTACSSSLVAFHYACNSIWGGESVMALAGGASAILRPETSIALSKGGFLSPDARCKAFDARANGYVRGEGAGIVVLKPVSAAIADGNPIYAVVRATGCNQDGRTQFITVPNRAAQETLIREVCGRAGIVPGDVQYVEAHGTGTAVGDPIEAGALGTVLSEGRPEGEVCVIGSVKTNIGHTEAAAGIAGVIKASLSLHHRQIPPNLHFETPNPAIDFAGLRVRVPTSLEPWPSARGPAMAAVNSFGFGGTNAHALLAEAPSDEPRASAGVPPVSLVPLSARSPEALGQAARRWLEFTGPGGAGDGAAFADLCHTASVRRTHHAQRLAVAASNVTELREALAAFAAGRGLASLTAGRAASTRPTVAFVYSGMGPQWWAMGRELLATEPVFREVLQRCDDGFRALGGWSLIEVLGADEAASRITETQFAQTANFALQAGLTALWRSWGIVPDAVVGHSVGEVASAFVAGALGFEDALRVSFYRSRAQSRAAGKGRMLAVGMTAEEARHLIAPVGTLVSLAAVNSPTSVTLSGDPEAVDSLQRTLTERGVFNRVLRVDIAYHSHHMDPLRAELLESLAGLTPMTPATPFVSTVTGGAVDRPVLDADYWWKNVRQPVRLSDALSDLMARKTTVFLEVGPHPVLASSIGECLQRAEHKAVVLGSLVREKPERRRMLESLAQLYTAGAPVDWAGVAPAGRAVRLPHYPWQRERHWIESEASAADRLGPAGHPLLGRRVSAPEPTWEAELNRAFVPYADDHKVEGTPVLPGAAYIEAALAAGVEASGAGEAPCALEDVRFHAPLVLSSTEDAPFMRTTVANGRFSVHARARNERAPWHLHASGKFWTGVNLGERDRVDLDAARARLGDVTPGDELYAHLRESRGLDYGPLFRGVTRLWRRGGEALAELRVPEAVARELAGYRLHPAVLDAAFHGLLALLPGDKRETLLPAGAESVWFGKRPGTHLFCLCRAALNDEGSLTGDVQLVEPDGTVAAEVRGLLCRQLNRGQQSDVTPRYFHLPRWLPQARTVEPSARAPGAWLVLGGSTEFGRSTLAALESQGGTAIVVERGAAFARRGPRAYTVNAADEAGLAALIRDLGNEHASLSAVVDLWSAEARLEDGGPAAITTVLHELTRLAVALHGRNLGTAPRWWTVLQGSESVAGSVAQRPEQGSFSGLTRVLRSELPLLRCSVIDLDAAEAGSAVLAAAVVDEIRGDAPDDAVAFRRSERYVQRWAAADPEVASPRHAVDLSRQACRLECGASGDRASWKEEAAVPPSAGEVSVRVLFAGLARNATGALVAADCVGVVEAVGKNVTAVAPGDSVVLLSTGPVRSFLTVPASSLVRVPEPRPFPAADVALTQYVLTRAARVRPGERVLVHGGSSGLGLSLVRMAGALGAKVSATSATREGRERLKAIEVEHVLDAASFGWFADTNGQAGSDIDAVINTLAGADLDRCARALAPRGRLIDLGGAARHGGPRLRANRTFASVDLEPILADDPLLGPELLREAVDAAAAGQFRMPPRRVFGVRETEAARDYLAEDDCSGAILQLAGETVSATPDFSGSIRADASYVVTGGLSGFGLATARWLAGRGARHLVLVSRRGAATPEATQGIAAIEKLGAKVRVIRADVADEAQVAGLVRAIEAEGPPLRGVFHSAMVLDDRPVERMDRAAFAAVMGPKAWGAWHLHQHTQHLPIDLFVLYSSVSSLGSSGQANYVAANGFLDALANVRRGMGLAGLSVNWSVVADTGIAARAMQAGGRAVNGFTGIPVDAMLDALGRFIRTQVAQAGFFGIIPESIELILPGFYGLPRFSELEKQHALRRRVDRAERPLREQLRSLDSAGREAALVDSLRRLASEVLGLALEQLDVEQGLGLLGLDSVMSAQLKVAIERNTGLSVPIVRIVAGPSVRELAAIVAPLLDPPKGSSDVAVPAKREERPMTSSVSRPQPVQHAFRSVDGVEIFGHLTMPGSGGPHPLVFVHTADRGGALNDKGEYTKVREHRELAPHGFAVFTVDQRGAPGHGPPPEGSGWLAGRDVDDVLVAAQFASQLPGIDAKRMAYLGTSRGAFTGLHVLARDNRRWRAAVLIMGFYDPVAFAEVERAERPETSPILRATKDWAVAMEYLREPSRNPLNSAPQVQAPLYLIHGNADRHAHLTHSERLHEIARGAGIEASLRVVEGMDHDLGGRHAAWPELWESIATFLKQRLM